jgi:hypothetical protein
MSKPSTKKNKLHILFKRASIEAYLLGNSGPPEIHTNVVNVALNELTRHTVEEVKELMLGIIQTYKGYGTYTDVMANDLEKEIKAL